MNIKTLKATIKFVKDCKNNKDYPYYFERRDMNIILTFLGEKVKEQERKNENRKNGLKGIL